MALRADEIPLTFGPEEAFRIMRARRVDAPTENPEACTGGLQAPNPPGTIPAETRNHMAYNKAEVKHVGDAVYDLLKGLSDGIGTQEVANLMGVLTAAVAASDEFKEDFDAAGPHILSQMADRFGDDRVNPVV